MVAITDQAAAVLHETMQASGVPEGNALRLSSGSDGFGLSVDSPTPNDHVLMHEETPVLLVAPEVEQALGEAVIEVQESEPGGSPQLVITRPE